MTGDTRIERQLPVILADLGRGPDTDYVELLLARTAATGQRPGWTFPERWIPMTTFTSRAVAAPRVPWRLVMAVVLLIVVLAAGGVLLGSQQQRLPPPFGRAANGLIADEANGDIRIVDPATGGLTTIVGGPEADSGPVWSRDGHRIYFVSRK